MISKEWLTRYGSCSLLLLGGLLPSGGQAAAGDEYLERIEAEAREMATTPITTRSATAAEGLGATGRMPLGLQQEEFEITLRDEFVGTHVFYQRLSAQNKRRIFELYRRDNRVSAIRAETIKLLSGEDP